LIRLGLVDGWTDLFGGPEFIAPDVAYSLRQRTLGAEKTEVIQTGPPRRVNVGTYLLFAGTTSK